jgi:predicted transport protein
MLIDPFEEKLGKMIIKRRQESEKIFEREMRTIADIVGYSISDEEYEIYDFLDALESCKECAKTYDAADNLCSHVFYNENCKSLKKDVSFTTVKCTWNYDYGEFRNKIGYILQEEELDIEKGFVYIFWSAAPLEYLYVGKAKSVIRLQNDKHSSVVRSIETGQATRLTVIHTNNRNIEDVEASIIRIFGIGTEKENLIYNKKEESFTEGNSVLSQRLSKLEKFFGQLYDKCKRTSKSNKQAHAKANPPIKSLHDEVFNYIQSFGRNISVKECEVYYAFKKDGKNFIGMRKNKLVLLLKLNPKTVKLEEGFTRDMSNIDGKFAPGDLEVRIEDEADFEKAKPLIKRAYEGN